MTATGAMLDDEGYPTSAALASIREWSWRDAAGLMAFIRSIWWGAESGWTKAVEEDGKTLYSISTWGWSGNESIIDALGANHTAWALLWLSSRRGGYYEFRRICTIMETARP